MKQPERYVKASDTLAIAATKLQIALVAHAKHATESLMHHREAITKAWERRKKAKQ